MPLIEHPEARAILNAHNPPGELTEARLRMARTPEGADLIENPVSKAPGFQMDNVFVMAGIPAIMQAMFESLSHGLVGGAPLQSRSVTIHLSESRMAPRLAALQERYPDVGIGSYPFSREGRFGARLVLRSTEDAPGRRRNRTRSHPARPRRRTHLGLSGVGRGRRRDYSEPSASCTSSPVRAGKNVQTMRMRVLARMRWRS